LDHQGTERPGRDSNPQLLVDCDRQVDLHTLARASASSVTSWSWGPLRALSLSYPGMRAGTWSRTRAFRSMWERVSLSLNLSLRSGHNVPDDAIEVRGD